MQIYLDNAATTKVCAQAADAAADAMLHTYGNPSSLHRLGMEAENLVTKAKKQLAAALSCQPGEILFTSGATESNNLAILGGCKAARRSGNKIVTSAVEHPSVLEPVRALEREGYEVSYIRPREDGSFSAQDFVDAVDERTALISAMLVNSEVGTRLPVEEITAGVRQKNPKTLVHIDAVQGFGKIPLSAKKLGADLISVSGHKIYAPKGIGALYIKKGVRVSPLLYGGGQQNGLRVGTECVPLIAAFGEAAAFCNACQRDVLARYKQLREDLLEILSTIPDVTVNSPEGSVPYILNLSVKGIRSEILLHFLEQAGIYVSSGSACSKGAKSHVLAAMGLPDERIDTAIRLSFSYETTGEQLTAFAARLKEGIDTLMKTT